MLLYTYTSTSPSSFKFTEVHFPVCLVPPHLIILLRYAHLLLKKKNKSSEHKQIITILIKALNFTCIPTDYESVVTTDSQGATFNQKT